MTVIVYIALVSYRSQITEVIALPNKLSVTSCRIRDFIEHTFSACYRIDASVGIQSHFIDTRDKSPLVIFIIIISAKILRIKIERKIISTHIIIVKTQDDICLIYDFF